MTGAAGPGEPADPSAAARADRLAGRLDEALAADDTARQQHYPGNPTARQPVHTAYVPADRFSDATVAAWGRAAIESLDAHGPLPTAELAAQTELVRAKLAREPVEDLRIDLEDSYGVRPDDVEDADVVRVALALAAAIGAGRCPPYVGIRIKSFEPAVRRRGLRSLQLFLETFLGGASLPAGFRVTLPKVTSVAQVAGLVEVGVALEAAYDLPGGSLRFEIQVETPQAVVGPDGTALVAPMIHAAAGRCVGLHYGTYDYSAALGISAAEQRMDHPAADFAKSVMQVAAAGTGVAVSDGSTNRLPVGGTAQVRSAWQLHARLVRRSLDRGIYQGWDLHPAQLPTRYAATYAFFRAGVPVAAERLQGYLQRQSAAIAEEPATAAALAGFLLRALRCGAVEAHELADPADPAGLTEADLLAVTTPVI
jgi:citrate lyase beta subunit